MSLDGILDELKADLVRMGYDIAGKACADVHVTRGPVIDVFMRDYPLEVMHWPKSTEPRGTWYGQVKPRTPSGDGRMRSVTALGFTRAKALEELKRLVDKELRDAQRRHAELSEHLNAALEAER